MADRTFADLKAPSNGKTCRRCGAESGYRVSVTANEAARTGNGKTMARRSWRLCESCAVTVYERLAGALDPKPRTQE